MRTIAFAIITMGKSDYLEGMLKSLEKYERVILVDNSPNGICKRLIGKYKFIYFHELKAGVSSARNAGASLAQDVDYIYFLDDDLSFGEGWHRELERMLTSDEYFDLIGGRVIADYSDDLIIPQKYLYLVGEKNLGRISKIVDKDYVGGCNLLVNTKIFFRLGGFDVNFGHVGTMLGLNEDVVFQELVRKNHGLVYYNPNLVFYHHWKGNEDDLLKRIRLQGIYDRHTDLETNRLRFIFRIIKYVVFVSIHRVRFFKKNICNVKYWDYLRYSSYISNN